MPKKKKVTEEDEVFHVEVITRARVSDEGDWEYLVKWAGYDSDANSWEPAENVKQCDRLLASFWKHIGTDDEDYSIGYEVAAREDWINKEKRYFTETFIKPSKRNTGKEAKKKEREETRQKSKSGTPRELESSANDSESSNDEPLVKMLTKKGAKRRALPVDTESEFESQGPLPRHGKMKLEPKATTSPIKEAGKRPTQAKRQDLVSTTGVTSVVPKVASIRTHQDRRANPLVKPMNLLTQNVEVGSLLATKQRIAAGMPPLTGPKPLLAMPPKKSLSSLSFKKIQAQDSTSTSSTVVTSPRSLVVQSTNIIDKADVVASPEPVDDDDEPVDLFGSFLEDPNSFSGSLEMLAVPLPPKCPEEINAERFLQTINIPVLSAPLEHISDTLPVQSAIQTTEAVKPLAMPKIPKKWKWSGRLLISSSGNRTELLCPVTIADPTGISHSSHISLLMTSQDSVHISRLYPIVDLSPIIRACGTSQYFGQLDPNEPDDELLIQGLKHHMTSQGLAAIIPLLLDGGEVAVLLVFPATQLGLAKVLQVPEYLIPGTPLLVVLLPFLVPSLNARKNVGWTPVDTLIQSLPSCKGVEIAHELPRRAILSQAISLLGFPKSLLDFLNSSTTSKAYCIWPLPGQSSSGLDTVLLQLILKSTKATFARFEDDVRVVFICNRDLETLQVMPSLVTKRGSSPETQFWTYGYSTSVTSSRWNLKEIFPLGGIMTFTATALTEDPVGCHQLMSQVIEHPLWHCYMIPEVLAVSHLLGSDDNPCPSSPSYLDPILDLVEAGLVCVTKMPGQGHDNHSTWLSQVLRDSALARHELLGVYVAALKEHSTVPGMTAQQLVTFTNDEVTNDLAKVQLQPAFMDNYRRFVVIRATSEETISAEKDGFEWCPLALFSFGDDYFQAARA